MSDGTGTTEGQGFTVANAALTLVLNYVDCNISGPTVGKINCSDQGTTNFEKYIAMTLKEGGTYVFTCNHNAQDMVALAAAVGVSDTWTITWPKSPTGVAASSDAVPGFISAIPRTVGKGDLIKTIVTIEVDGDPTFVNETLV